MYVVQVLFVCFFFFSSRRRHTRSKRDWSSDVCSSDLGDGICPGQQTADHCGRIGRSFRSHSFREHVESDEPVIFERALWRSEERRVGKECRSRWSTYHEKKKNKEDVATYEFDIWNRMD